jgi:hypothetical protein
LTYRSLIPASSEKARRLNPPGMARSHYLVPEWPLHRRKFDALCLRVAARQRLRPAS